MKNLAKVLLVTGAVSGSCLHAQKCEANLNGFRIHNIYIAGTSYNAVSWAYKHISEESCLTPVTSLDKADAILELSRPDRPTPVSSVFTVTCSGSAASSQCSDSDGNELDVSCDKSGYCSSYYGPSPGAAVGAFLKEAVFTGRAYAAIARIYTIDHKLVWDSEMEKGTLWQDKLKKPPLAPACKLPGAWSSNQYHFQYRNWAAEKCGISFDPAVSIDIKANDRLARIQAPLNEVEEMKRNAAEAATKVK